MSEQLFPPISGGHEMPKLPPLLTTTEFHGAIILNTIASASAVQSLYEYLENCVQGGMIHRVFDHVGYMFPDHRAGFMSHPEIAEIEMNQKKTGGFKVYVRRIPGTEEVQLYLLRKDGDSQAAIAIVYSTIGDAKYAKPLLGYHSFENTTTAMEKYKKHSGALWLNRMAFHYGIPMDFCIHREELHFYTSNPYLNIRSVDSPTEAIRKVIETYLGPLSKLSSIQVVGNGFFFEVDDGVSVQIGHHATHWDDVSRRLMVNITIVYKEDQNVFADVSMNFLMKDITTEMNKLLERDKPVNVPAQKPLPWYRRIFKKAK